MKTDYIKLGAFILIGLLIFIGALYYLGTRNNLFVDKIKITSTVSSAQGIQEGSNVRLAGVKVGVVEDVKIISDSTVRLTMMVNADDAKFIKKDAKVSIGTAGLMGNKIVDISDGTAGAQAVDDGDSLPAKNAADLDNIKYSVLENSRNLEVITKNLVEITRELSNGKGVLGALLVDSTLSYKMESAINSLDITAENSAQLTQRLNTLTQGLNEGKGVAGTLLNDESMAKDIKIIVDSLKSSSIKMNEITANISLFSEKLNNKQGTLNRLMTDTTMADNIAKTIYEARQRTMELEKSIETINNSWVLNLFGGNKSEKKKGKAQRASDEEVMKK